jgi:lambda family phage portal protein
MNSVATYFRNIGSAIFAPKAGALSSYYDAGSATRRTKGWDVGTTEVNALISGSGQRLRSYSRDTIRKNQLAAAALDSVLANWIGTGIKPQPKHQDPVTKKKLQDLWNRWTDECDPAGNVDFYGMQFLALRETFEAGEILARKRTRRVTDKFSVPLQIQMLESEHLPYERNATIPGGYIQAGIEFNALGQKVAYWLWRQHPGSFVSLPQPQELTRVPSDQVIHSYKVNRANQLRGEPWLTTVLIKLHELGKYDDAEMVRKACAAMIAFVIEENDPNDPATTERDDAGVPIAPVEPGSTVKLRRGETMKTLGAADVGGMYEPFMRMQQRGAIVPTGATYEGATGDLSQVNYSSMRGGRLESKRKSEQYLSLFLNKQFNQPIWNAFIAAAVMAGEIRARDYQRDPYQFTNVDWRSSKWDWVDPLKDVEAEERMCRGGFKARSQTINEMGYDEEEVDATIAADAKRADSLGLKFDSDGRNAPASAKVTQTGNTADAAPGPNSPIKKVPADTTIQ